MKTKMAFSLALIALMLASCNLGAGAPAPREVSPTHAQPAIAAAGHQSASHAGSTALPPSAFTPTSNVAISIDPATRYQTFSGFGASFRAFDGPFSKLDDPTGPDFTTATEEQRRGIAEILYHQLGLARTRFFPDFFEPANDNTDPFSFNAYAYDWKEVDQLTEFSALGKTLGLETPWLSFSMDQGHTQAWLRKPGSCALDPAMLDEDVEWILAAALHFRDAGQDLPYLTINNEPDLCPPGHKIEIPDYVTIVKRLGARLGDEGLGTQLVITDGWIPQNTLLYARAVLADPEARQYVGAIATHAYADGYDDPATVLNNSAQGNPPHAAVEVRSQLRELAAQYNLPVWITEICYCTPRSSEFSEFELIRARLNHLHDELTLGNASAFDVMNLYNIRRPGVYDELVEVAYRPDGSMESYRVSTYGQLIGQYALAIPPGSVRLKAESSDARVRTLAFVRPDGKQVVIALNNNPTAVQATLNTPVTFSTLVSREGAILQSAPDTSATLTLPPSSVTTLVEK